MFSVTDHDEEDEECMGFIDSGHDEEDEDCTGLRPGHDGSLSCVACIETDDPVHHIGRGIMTTGDKLTFLEHFYITNLKDG